MSHTNALTNSTKPRDLFGVSRRLLYYTTRIADKSVKDVTPFGSPMANSKTSRNSYIAPILAIARFVDKQKPEVEDDKLVISVGKDEMTRLLFKDNTRYTRRAIVLALESVVGVGFSFPNDGNLPLIYEIRDMRDRWVFVINKAFAVSYNATSSAVGERGFHLFDSLSLRALNAAPHTLALLYVYFKLRSFSKNGLSGAAVRFILERVNSSKRRQSVAKTLEQMKRYRLINAFKRLYPESVDYHYAVYDNFRLPQKNKVGGDE